MMAARTTNAGHNLWGYPQGAACASASLLGGMILLASLLAGCSQDADDVQISSEKTGQGESNTRAQVVHLTKEKIRAAGIQIAPVRKRPLKTTHRVAGKLDYEASHVLDLRVPVACTVQHVLVHPGQQVGEGETLAILSSVQVGRARDEVRDLEADLLVASMDHKWLDEIASSVVELVEYLEEQPAMDAVEQQFADRRLGQHRNTLLSAYSRLRLASQMIEDSAQLAAEGVLSSRTVQERQSALEVARAEFRSAREQTRQEASMARARSLATLRQAERLLKVSREHLQTLLGPLAESESGEDVPLNEFRLRAPFDGRVQQQYAVTAMQIAENEPLFLFANTDMLWVSAQIHDRNWSAISVASGQPLTVTSPALPDLSFTARVKFVGASVSLENRTIPLVAELENQEQRFKPGMFVWVTIPVEAAREAIAVPAASLQRHETQTFVFVAEDETTFRRVDVVPGLETPEWVEITEGLEEGQRVVDRGAFDLKSELLLEREEE